MDYKLLDTHKLSYKYLKIFLVVVAYWTISIITVFVNKTLLSSSTVNLNAPLFVTWCQCVISTGICFSISSLSAIFPKQITFPKASNAMDIETLKNLLPLSILFTLMISTNNLCLKYVGVAFYYVGRCLTTVFNVIFSFLILRQRTSIKCILCCAAIIFGFMLGVDQESLTESFSWKGTVFGVLGSLSLSLFSIHTKKTLCFVNGETWLLIYYNNLYSSLLFIPLILINGELNELSTYQHFDKLWFWFVIVAGGVCGFSIGFITVLQIKLTSPLTHNISGTAKACLQTVIATQWYQETKSFLWWSSNVIVLLASAFYTRVRQLEMEINHKTILAQRA